MIFFRLKNKLDQIPESEHVIVDFSLCDFVDHTVMEGLYVYNLSFKRKSGIFEIIGLDIHASESQHPFAVRKSLPINALIGLQKTLSNRQKNLEKLAEKLKWTYEPKIESDPEGIENFLFFESKTVNYSVNSLWNHQFNLFDLSFSEGAFITKEDLKATFLLFKSPKNLPVFVLDKEDFKILLSHDPSHWDSEIKNHTNNYHLTLSGHTHGMQFGIEIPGLKWSPVQYVYKQWAGIYNEAHKYINVNKCEQYVK